METSKARRRLSIAVRVVLFALIGIVIYRSLTVLFMPYQSNSIFTDKAKAFRAEPQNTVEVLVLGPSTAADDFNPIRLYERHGICAYNLGTSKQPLLASYTLAQEAYRLHPQTLRTIVLDCSVLRYTPESGFYRIPLDEVPLESKAENVLGWEEAQDDEGVYLDPMYAYHNRWSTLDESDVGKLLTGPHGFLRGFEPSWKVTMADNDLAELPVPAVAPDPAVEPAELDPEQVDYTRRLDEFCEEHGITLLFMKTPLPYEWGDAEHNAVQELADELGVAFIDCNYEPFVSQSGFNAASDTKDNYHANVSGANKITDYLGDYLMANGLATDVRGDDAYGFMEGELEDFRAMDGALIDLRSQVDPVSYLALAMENPRYTVFVGLDGEGARELTQDQRRRLEDLGLDWLASTREGQCYRGVIRDGLVVNEDLSTRADERLYTCYQSDTDYVEPRHSYFMMFRSSDPEAIQAMAYEADPGSSDLPEWFFPPAGLTCIVYDEDLAMVVDYAPFKALAHLQRYAYPQEMLDACLAAGAEDGELSWFLYQYKEYSERLAERLTPQPIPVSEEAAASGDGSSEEVSL